MPCRGCIGQLPTARGNRLNVHSVTLASAAPSVARLAIPGRRQGGPAVRGKGVNPSALRSALLDNPLGCARPTAGWAGGRRSQLASSWPSARYGAAAGPWRAASGLLLASGGSPMRSHYRSGWGPKPPGRPEGSEDRLLAAPKPPVRAGWPGVGRGLTLAATSGSAGGQAQGVRQEARSGVARG